VDKITKKNKECVFVNSTLKIVKNTLLQTAFSAILPTQHEQANYEYYFIMKTRSITEREYQYRDQ